MAAERPAVEAHPLDQPLEADLDPRRRLAAMPPDPRHRGQRPIDPMLPGRMLPGQMRPAGPMHPGPTALTPIRLRVRIRRNPTAGRMLRVRMAQRLTALARMPRVRMVQRPTALAPTRLVPTARRLMELARTRLTPMVRNPTAVDEQMVPRARVLPHEVPDTATLCMAAAVFLAIGFARASDATISFTSAARS